MNILQQKNLLLESNTSIFICCEKMSGKGIKKKLPCS